MLIIVFINLLFVYLINTTISYETRDCVKCKWFIPYKNNNINELGCCKMFGNKVNDINNTEKIMYNFAKHCRDDNNLCGSTGILFEIKETEIALTNKKNSTYTYTNSYENENDNKLNPNTELMKMINDYANFIMRHDW